jgi:hypothetical protein
VNGPNISGKEIQMMKQLEGISKVKYSNTLILQLGKPSGLGSPASEQTMWLWTDPLLLRFILFPLQLPSLCKPIFLGDRTD